MLAVESIQWVIDDGELVVGAAEPPEDVAGPCVKFGDFRQIPERGHVIAVMVDIERVGMVEIHVLLSPSAGRLFDPVVDTEMVPGVPHELDRPSWGKSHDLVTREERVGWPSVLAQIGTPQIV